MNALQTNYIADAEQLMLSMPQADCSVTHKFQPGYYIRELVIPTGAIAIGHHQNFPQLNVFVRGKVMMLNDDGTTKVLEAPMTFVGDAGRKIGYVLEEVVWQNVYPTDVTDVETLEAMFLTKSEYSQEHNAHKFALESLAHEEDRVDYAAAIAELGYTQEQVDKEVHNLDDQIGMPIGDYKCVLAISPIEGQGVFASANIAAGEIIGVSRIGFHRTPLGRYTNHSKNPNAEMAQIGTDFFLIATQNIVGALGGQPGQEITIDYRAAKQLAIGA